MFAFKPRKYQVFQRTTNLENQFTSITFGNKIKSDIASQSTLTANTLWNNTVLGGFLKTNIQLHELKEITDWFRSYLQPLVLTQTRLDNYITYLIENKQISKINLISFLKQADFNISDFTIQKSEEEVPPEFINMFKKQIFSIDRRITNVESKTKITLTDLEFEHIVGREKYTLSFEQESQGTNRYYGLTGLLIYLIKYSITIPIDELESSLHPDLCQHFLLSFLVNSKRSQLIATIHNREILDNKDIFRDDAIWMTNKDETCSTSLYSLADFDPSTIQGENRLKAYSSGQFGGVPNLGDYYFDTSTDSES